jgi:hypothetical protein
VAENAGLRVPVFTERLPRLAFELNATPTAKLTLKLLLMPFPPVTVMVAVYVPATSPVTGTTVKLSVPLTSIPLMPVFDTVKLAAFVPAFPIVRAPVARFPVLVTIMVLPVWAS